MTRTQEGISALDKKLGRAKGFSTTTTPNLGKLEPRLARRNDGDCAILAIAITDRCFTDS